MDVLIALGAFALTTLPVLAGLVDGHGPLGVIAALGLLTAAPLAFRRRWPRAVTLVVVLALVIGALAEIRFTAWVSNAGPALGVAVFTLAERYPRRASAWMAAAAIGAVTTSEIVGYVVHPGTDQNAVHLLIGPAGWLLGRALRTRREVEAQLRAERARREAEAERRIRVEERLRVSADVHDIVSHALALIAVRAGVARMVLQQRPGEARSALSAIEGASRTALDELRAVLRDESLGGAGPSRPSLADVRPLVESTRRDGLPVDLVFPDDLGASPLVEESAYRITQEALTNVVRHAGAVATRVELSGDGRILVIDVLNGRGLPGDGSPGSGLGLAGMRRRVELHGGSLETGATHDGGFRVKATLPASGTAEEGVRTARERERTAGQPTGTTDERETTAGGRERTTGQPTGTTDERETTARERERTTGAGQGTAGERDVTTDERAGSAQ
ncbi:sensor histidine kinase [Kineosporia succinea]|uniref:histidine kinase n=1 Tax=Kineosporia succinea TaxID=84632 RepID=A0ABT9PDG1_9ACTN|nr:histidine kinase [Kineosporia succinea]MDP9830752.1 signal transduction histidine kinase [Kineosporia succinea]